MPDYFDPFVTPSPLEAHFLRQVIEIASLCYERGWVWGTSGNFSVKLRKNLVWQSPSGVCKGKLHPRQFLPVHQETGRIIWPDPGLKPSEEMAVHLALFHHIPQARCIIHAHPKALVRESRGRSELCFQGEEMQKALGCRHFDETLRIPLVPNQRGDTLDEFCQNHLASGLSHEAGMIVFSGHGTYVWGQDPFEALKRMEALEFLCSSTRNHP